MKYWIYARYDTVAKLFSPLTIQVNDDCAIRYYREFDNAMKNQYNIDTNQAENIIVCLGEMETQGVENKDISKRFYLDNPLTLKKEVYNILDLRPGDKPNE